MMPEPSRSIHKQTLADRFFSEREATLPATNAEEFYINITYALERAPHYNHTPTGDILQHKRGKNTILQQPPVIFFFRGQSDASFGLNSSLYRATIAHPRQKRRSSDIEILLSQAENRVLNTARNHGLIRGLTPLESLTILQHHGVPTRLIDVTSDWRVALYFATETGDTTDGRLFAVTTSDKQWRTFPRAEGDGLAWQQGAIKTWESAVIPVLLPFSDARMVAQCGFFLVGGTTTKAHGNRWHSPENGTLSSQKIKCTTYLPYQ